MNTWLLRGIGLCVCAGVLIAAANSTATAHRHVRGARATYTDTANTAHRFAAARLTESVAVNPSSDGQDAMVARVSSSLTRAGIPVGRMTSLSPGTAAAEGVSVRLSDGTTVRRVRRSASMTLDQVSLPELGGFLQEWRAAQPEWRIVSLQATPIPLRAGDVPTTTPAPFPVGTPLVGNMLARPLTVHLTIEAGGVERIPAP